MRKVTKYAQQGWSTSQPRGKATHTTSDVSRRQGDPHRAGDDLGWAGPDTGKMLLRGRFEIEHQHWPGQAVELESARGDCVPVHRDGSGDSIGRTRLVGIHRWADRHHVGDIVIG